MQDSLQKINPNQMEDRSSDKSMKQMAVKIIEAQEKEISKLQDWLLARGHK